MLGYYPNMNNIEKFKKCPKCELTLSTNKFYKHKSRKDGFQVYCKKCMAKVNSDSFQNHKEKRVKKSMEYGRTEKGKKYRREWAKDKYDTNEEYRKDCIKKVVAREKVLLETDPEFKLIHTLRGRVRSALKTKNAKKNMRTLDLTGCTISFLMEFLEKKFIEGMTWENHGDWHIDHIKPISLFNLLNEEEQKKCFHYTNLQPLWAADNLSKSNKYNENS